MTIPVPTERPGLARTISRVEPRIRLGPDSQVDDKAIIINPGDALRTDPFLLLAEDWFSSPGFEWHPHRGIETVTLVLDGVLEHGDSLGNAGALQAGDVQWMTAGRGIIHRELAFRNEFVHTLQLWVNLPASAKMADTRYQDLLAAGRPRADGRGSRIDVISGDAGVAVGKALNHWPISGALITLEPGAAHAHPLPAEDRAFAYVIGGEASIAGRAVREGEIAWSEPAGSVDETSSLRVSAPDHAQPTTVMVYSGRPIAEPIAMGGPFVMNSREEIVQAYADFRRGAFGEVPRQARLHYL